MRYIHLPSFDINVEEHLLEVISNLPDDYKVYLPAPTGSLAKRVESVRIARDGNMLTLSTYNFGFLSISADIKPSREWGSSAFIYSEEGDSFHTTLEDLIQEVNKASRPTFFAPVLGRTFNNLGVGYDARPDLKQPKRIVKPSDIKAEHD